MRARGFTVALFQNRLGSLAVAICVTTLLAASQSAAHEHASEPKPRGTQSLDVYRDGNVLHLLTARYEDGTETPHLLYQRSADSGESWSTPVQVDAGMPAAKTPRRGSDPQIAAAGDNVIAIWTVPGTGYGDSGPMATALSKDGGKTWRAGSNPADDNNTLAHSYIDAAIDEHGAVHLVWLDNRNGKQALRYARSDDGGEHWKANKTLDPETCECCWNTLLVGANNRVWTLYRDKDPRDMALAISENAGESWQRAGYVGSFGWQFPNCPEAGGGLAISAPPSGAETLHAIVRTGKESRSGIHYQSSNDGGRHWSSPRCLEPGVSDHPSLAGDSSGNLVATWDTLDQHDLVIKASVSRNNGKTWSQPLRISSPGTDASHPRALTTPTGLRVFWTYTSKGEPQNWTSHALETFTERNTTAAKAGSESFKRTEDKPKAVVAP